MRIRSKPGTELAAVGMILLFIAVLLNLALPLTTAKAQTQITAEQLANLQPLDPSQIPPHATFWELFYGSGSNQPVPAPVPRNPYGPEVPVYYIDGHYFICNGPDDLNLFQQQRQRQAQMGLMQPMADSGTIVQPQDVTPLDASFAPGTFYICSLAVSAQTINLVLTNTVQDTYYEILSKDLLTNTTDWASEGIVEGLDGSTPATLWMGNRTNQIWLRALSWVDSSGSGIPDWWMMKYFGPDQTTWPDPYADLNGDGHTVIEAYNNGWNPKAAHTPSPPQNVAARVDATGTNVIVTWVSGGGPVSQYAIENSAGSEYQRVSASTFVYTNILSYVPALSVFTPPSYRVRTYFTDGTSAVSPVVSIGDPALSITGAWARGPGFTMYLVISPVPQSASAIRLLSDLGYPPVDIPVASFQNGAAVLTNWAVLSSERYITAMAISTSGTFGSKIDLYAFDQRADELLNWREGAPSFLVPEPEEAFVDASHHIKENLRFLLRSAMVTWPFGYLSDRQTDGTEYPWGLSPDPMVNQPETLYSRPPGSGDYEYYGFHVYSPNLGWSILDEMRPVQENFLWTNFILSASWPSLASWDDYHRIRTLRTADQPFQPSGNDTNPPLAFNLSAADAWTYAMDTVVIFEPGQIGLSIDSNWNGTVLPNIVNNYGLALRSIATDMDTNFVVIPSGQSGSIGAECFTDFTAPDLRITNYYFASQTPYLTKYPWTMNAVGVCYYGGPPIPVPGSPAFSPTNTSPLLITGIGQPITVSAWAKMAIDNADSGHASKFGYLEQYLDQALVVDQNGNTNQAGVVSPYGSFFPTMPGSVAIVTMPDVDTGQCGTGVVNVIKLALDVNHDGTMDLSFGGPDNTSRESPFVFWVNNDRDVPSTGKTWSNPLDHDIVAAPDQPATQDWYQGKITCARGLEDFARLWICGVPSNQTFTARLSLNSISGSPMLNLYYGETNGGTLYLTDTNIAKTLVGRTNFCTISPGTSYDFPAGFFDGSNNYFLFEGCTNGSGELVLSILQGTNVLAQTSAYIDLHDIKDLYEQPHITGITNQFPQMVEQPTTSGFKIDKYPVQAGQSDSQIIVFVHGWRLGTWSYHNFAETMFKRLYWQGFNGRFVAPYWPTLPGEMTSEDPLSFLTFNPSEFIALESGTGIASYLSSLKQRFPNATISVCSHSQGACVMAEALRQLAAAHQSPVQHYVMMQPAFPANAYDASVTNWPTLQLIEQVVPTPNTYSNYAQSIGAALQGSCINYFNTNDFAMQLWNINNAYLVADTNSWNGWSTMKPWSFADYRTDGTICGELLNGVARSVTNSYEVIAFVTRARSLSLGEQPGVGGAISGGELDLKQQFGFTGEWYDHSGEFNRSIQEPQGTPFYFRLLRALRTGQP